MSNGWRSGDRVAEPAAVGSSYGSDLIAGLLRSAGIEYAALNPGASFRGIHDSIVNHLGNHQPSLVTSLHEQIAVGIAHGYAMASGRPMAALLHDVVGLQQASVAIYSAYIDRAPVIVIGGTGPIDAARRRPWIDWIHTAQVQADLVRQFIKWDDQPSSVQAIPRSFARAMNVATSAPAGPIYLCYDADLQESVIDQDLAQHTDLERYPRPTRFQADHGAIVEVADRLSRAESPVIITEYAGRYPGAAEALVQLADVLGAPLIVLPGRYNAPSTHPLVLTRRDEDVLSTADAILAVEVMDLFGYFHTGPDRRPMPERKPTPWIAHLTLGDLGIKGWSQDFQEVMPLDLEVRADAGIALPAIVEACRHQLRGQSSPGRVARRAAIEELSGKGRSAIRNAASQVSSGRISRLALSGTIAQALAKRDYVIAKDLLHGSLYSLLDIDTPERWVGLNAAGGLGNALALAVGVPLGRPGHEVYVAVLGDGDFLYTPSALWTAVSLRLPLVVIVANNRSYMNDENHQRAVAKERGRPGERAGVGTRLDDPAADLAMLARSFGALGLGPVQTISELGPALKTAIDHAAGGNGPALVDVLSE